MESEIISKAIILAQNVKEVYRKIKCYSILDNEKKVEYYKTDLNFLFSLEEELYKSMINQDLTSYDRIIIKKFPYVKFNNYYTIFFHMKSLDPVLRVYYRIKYLEEVRNYNNEFYLHEISTIKSASYLKNMIIHNSLFYLLENENQNHYNRSNYYFTELKYYLCYLFYEQENKYCKAENLKLEYPNPQTYYFANCLDIEVDEAVNFFAIQNTAKYFECLEQSRALELTEFFSHEKKVIHEFYLHFLFFLIQDEQKKADYQFLLEQYASIIPELQDIAKYNKDNIEKDCMILKQIKKNNYMI